MSSKKKLLRKIMAGLVSAPSGWEQFAPAGGTPTPEAIVDTVVATPPTSQEPTAAVVTETRRSETRTSRKTKAPTRRTKRRGPRRATKE